ncbi:MAG: hypothetical protein ACXW4P_10185, partial [Thermoanaerobaculia bacterium]
MAIEPPLWDRAAKLRVFRDGPPPAPPAFIASRLALTEEWLARDSARELRPSQPGALVLARI